MIKLNLSVPAVSIGLQSHQESVTLTGLFLNPQAIPIHLYLFLTVPTTMIKLNIYLVSLLLPNYERYR